MPQMFVWFRPDNNENVFNDNVIYGFEIYSEMIELKISFFMCSFTKLATVLKPVGLDLYAWNIQNRWMKFVKKNK